MCPGEYSKVRSEADGPRPGLVVLIVGVSPVPYMAGALCNLTLRPFILFTSFVVTFSFGPHMKNIFEDILDKCKTNYCSILYL